MKLSHIKLDPKFKTSHGTKLLGNQEWKECQESTDIEFTLVFDLGLTYVSGW